MQLHVWPVGSVIATDDHAHSQRQRDRNTKHTSIIYPVLDLRIPHCNISRELRHRSGRTALCPHLHRAQPKLIQISIPLVLSALRRTICPEDGPRGHEVTHARQDLSRMASCPPLLGSSNSKSLCRWLLGAVRRCAANDVRGGSSARTRDDSRVTGLVTQGELPAALGLVALIQIFVSLVSRCGPALCGERFYLTRWFTRGRTCHAERVTKRHDTRRLSSRTSQTRRPPLLGRTSTYRALPARLPARTRSSCSSSGPSAAARSPDAVGVPLDHEVGRLLFWCCVTSLNAALVVGRPAAPGQVLPRKNHVHHPLDECPAN
jgi:hypothetical protein